MAMVWLQPLGHTRTNLLAWKSQPGVSTIHDSSQTDVPQIYAPAYTGLGISYWEIAQYAYLSANVSPNRDSLTG